MRKFADKLDQVLSKIEENLIFVLMFTMLGVVFLGIINRFIMKESIPWAEELSRFLLIWSAMLGTSLGVKKSVHISIDALVNILPQRMKNVAVIASYMLSIVFCLIMLVIGGPFVISLMDTNQLSPALSIPMYVAYASVPVGLMFMGIRYMILTILACTAKKADEGGI